MERFHREASTIQRLDHPHIVKIVEVGWEGPEPFIVFEYFKNGSLEKLVDPNNPLNIPAVMDYALQIAGALKYADEQGVIHRDIKPRNLFLDDDNNIKLGDFGLARMADRTTLTLQGEFFGTPYYLAPELLKGGKSSVQTDMYALGVTIFELAAGRRPFVGENDESIIHQRMRTDSPRVCTYRPDATDAFDNMVSRMLNADPALRHADYGELLADLRSVAALRVTAP
jgi:serine/threonine-protein kinase